MKERSANIDNDQDIVDFWNELVRNYGYCIRGPTGLSDDASYWIGDFENYVNHNERINCHPMYELSDTYVLEPEIEKDFAITTVLPEISAEIIYEQPSVYDQSKFCMAQPFSFSENCYPMCEIIKNCETHDNFLCPDDDIKPLMEKCCNLWDDEFECETSTTTTTSTPDAVSIPMMNVNFYRPINLI